MVGGIPIIGGIAVVLVWSLGGLVLATGGGRRASRLLAALLLFEGVFLLHVPLMHFGPGGWPEAVASLSFVIAVGFLPATYLAFLAPLETPLVRPLCGRERGIIVAGATVGTLLVSGFVGSHLGLIPVADWVTAPILLLYAVILVYAVVVAVSAYRRATPGTAARARARAFAIAFVTRDLLLVLAIAASITLQATGGSILGVGHEAAAPLIAAIAGALYAALLAYGILQTQLFDLDLRVKVGIRRSTVVTIILVVALAAAKTAEFYLNKTYGFVAGGVAAGAMLVLAPRLNKMGEKVANTAMPQVQPTPAYVQFKKLEVYKAAVESAIETGGLTPKDRASLDRLSAKLGLAAEDVRAVEADVTGAAPT